MEWKWTKGDPYERSRRPIKQPHENDVDNFKESQQFNKELEIGAYTSALNHDENTWDILNQTIANGGFKVSNKREDLDLKIADRMPVQQRGFNPFLGENNYIEDMDARDMFLKPQNTSEDRIKHSND